MEWWVVLVKSLAALVLLGLFASVVGFGMNRGDGDWSDWVMDGLICVGAFAVLVVVMLGAVAVLFWWHP
jgi:hypothetical protein